MDDCGHRDKHDDCKKCQEKLIKVKIEIDHTRHNNPFDAAAEIAQRFYQFQDAGSRAKSYGQDPNPTIMNQALAELAVFLIPTLKFLPF